MELVVPKIKECWRCQFILRGDGEVYQGHCPRCACDLSLIDLEAIENEAERRSWQAAKDLGMMYTNWAKGYCRIIEEKCEADYSLVYEFAIEVMEQSFPYISRLQDEEILQPEGKQYIKDILNNCTLMIINACEQYEDWMRLAGVWDDDEQEIKEYWQERIGATKQIIQSPAPRRIPQIKISGEDGKE